jgi:DMSO/TMAO reductase YedYZ heme-binding membrane subunit
MSLIFSLGITVVFAAIFAKPLKSCPLAFYLLAVLVCAVSIYLTYVPSSNQLVRSFVFAVQKGHVGFSFFTMVMFTGVFSRDSAIRQYLNPVRAELSIMAAILIIAHFVPYLSNYLSYSANLLSLRLNIATSLLIALVMLVLLLVLTVTSFNAIKKRMNAGKWRFLQRFAYLFYGLILAHLLGYLIIPALNGSSSAIVGVATYALVFGAYLLFRVRRSLSDKKAESAAIA